MHLVSADVAQARVAKWFMEAKPVEQNPTWTERRLAIVFGEHTYLLVADQVFQCNHCGWYDPHKSAQEVIKYFKEKFNISPIEINVTCSVAEVTE